MADDRCMRSDDLIDARHSACWSRGIRPPTSCPNWHQPAEKGQGRSNAPDPASTLPLAECLGTRCGFSFHARRKDEYYLDPIHQCIKRRLS